MGCRCVCWNPGAAQITASGTYWLTGGPMAAAMATLDVIEADGSAAMQHMQAMWSEWNLQHDASR